MNYCTYVKTILSKTIENMYQKYVNLCTYVRIWLCTYTYLLVWFLWTQFWDGGKTWNVTQPNHTHIISKYLFVGISIPLYSNFIDFLIHIRPHYDSWAGSRKVTKLFGLRRYFRHWTQSPIPVSCWKCCKEHSSKFHFIHQFCPFPYTVVLWIESFRDNSSLFTNDLLEWSKRIVYLVARSYWSALRRRRSYNKKQRNRYKRVH